jgi:hypothetical protein
MSDTASLFQYSQFLREDKKMRKLILLSCAAALLGGCATRASGVAPISVSATDYAGLSCEETRAQLDTARQRENALTRQQNNAATADAASVLLFALPLGSVFGADVEGELAQAKGEALALQRAVTMNCSRQPAAAASPAATTPNTQTTIPAKQ